MEQKGLITIRPQNDLDGHKREVRQFFGHTIRKIECGRVFITTLYNQMSWNIITMLSMSAIFKSNVNYYPIMQPPNEAPTPPQPTVVGSVAQSQYQSFDQPQTQTPVIQVTQPQIVGQPIMMQQMPGTVVMGGGYPKTSATTALVLSIVSVFIGGICLAIPALIVANGALTITNQIPGHPEASTAKAAQVISWIVIGLSIVALLFIFMMIMATASTI